MAQQVSDLGDGPLEAELRRLLRCQPPQMADVLAHLAEFDARRLYVRAGYPSLFAYCCGALRLSEAEAYGLVDAARAARRTDGSAPLAC